MKTERKLWDFRPGDAAAIAGVVICALALLAWFLLSASTGEARVARIYQHGELIRELRLSEDGDLTVGGEYTNHISVRDGKIAVTESDCPGADCVHSGWIARPGLSIVCLPNRLEIRLEGGAAPEEEEVDAVVW